MRTAERRRIDSFSVAALAGDERMRFLPYWWCVTHNAIASDRCMAPAGPGFVQLSLDDESHERSGAELEADTGCEVLPLCILDTPTKRVQ